MYCLSSSLFSLVIISIFTNGEILINRELPCDIIDSINITAGILLNGNITFNGIEYSKDQYAEVDYILKNGVDRTNVEPHIRGCICLKLFCIRLCCPYGSFDESMEFGEEVKCHENETAKNIQSEVLNENDEINILNLDQHFGYVDQICEFHYYANDFLFTHVRNKRFCILFYFFKFFIQISNQFLIYIL